MLEDWPNCLLGRLFTGLVSRAVVHSSCPPIEQVGVQVVVCGLCVVLGVWASILAAYNMAEQ